MRRMTALLHAFGEGFRSLRSEGWRLLPMSLGIVWGMASIMVLLAVASGFEKSQKHALSAYGDRFVLLRVNRGELDRAANRYMPRLRMDTLDIERLRRGAPAIKHLSPMNMAYRARVTARNGAGGGVRIAGALPEIAALRHLPLAEGRFFNEVENATRRRVIVLGPTARRQLFGRGPAVGRIVRVAGFSTAEIPQRVAADDPTVAGRRGAAALIASGTTTSQTGGDRAAPETARDVNISAELFEVIGVLDDVEVQRESYVSVARLAFIPYATACVVFQDDYNTIFVEPRSSADRDLAIRQFREVVGARYGFEPDDRNAVLVYFDAIERARRIEAIFGTLRLFLSAVGVLILAIGAVGVMNAVLVSVTARTYEIGLRKALGATPLTISLQFFAETVAGCFASGALGVLVGAGGIAVLAAVPLPEGFSRPVLDLRTSLTAFALLASVAVVVGIVPARRAASLAPVDSLRARG